MKPEGILKYAGLTFIAALALYVVAYSSIEHRRTRQGPWRVAFTNDSAGAPALLVNQPKLAITNVLITFASPAPAANSTAVLALDQPRPVPYDVPFGRCIFMDTTFLPGTIVFELFGHQVQLLPRVLTIDGREYPWRSGQVIPLAGTNWLREPSVP